MACKADIRFRHRQRFFLSSPCPNKLCDPPRFLLIGTASFAEGNSAGKWNWLLISSWCDLLPTHSAITQLQEMPTPQEVIKASLVNYKQTLKSRKCEYSTQVHCALKIKQSNCSYEAKSWKMQGTAVARHHMAMESPHGKDETDQCLREHHKTPRRRNVTRSQTRRSDQRWNSEYRRDLTRNSTEEEANLRNTCVQKIYIRLITEALVLKGS